MRTTIELPDELYLRVKHEAVERGLPIRELVRQALERLLRDPSGQIPGPDIPPPMVKSRKPGSVKLTPEQVHEILVREERATYETPSGR
jgi:hypothetical protein